jgi:lysophospholipase L1-like esterase
MLWMGIALVISFGANVYLARTTLAYLRQLYRVQLDPTSERTLPTMPPVGKRLRIVLFGDSRIAAWHSFPMLPGTEVINRGVPGETTAQAWLRIDRDLRPSGAKVVVIQSGINDLKTIGVFPNESTTIMDRCFSNLSRIVTSCREEQMDVVLLSIVPPSQCDLMRRPIWSTDVYEAVKTLNARLQSLQGDHVVVTDVAQLVSEGGRLREEYSLDMFHLNREGYEVLNGLVRAVLQNTLQTVDSGNP